MADETIIPKHIQEMRFVAGYVRMFYMMLPDYATHEECFDACERIYMNYFGEYRYSDYDSFRVAKSRQMNNKDNGNN
jgi:hypothetical protein